MKLKSIFLGLLCSLSTSVAYAAVPLGNGFSCSGSSILKGTKVVTFTKAKSTLAATLANLQKSLNKASKSKKPGINAKIKAAKQTQTYIKSCSKGKLTDFIAKLTIGTGTFSGVYNGVVGGFLPINGPVTVNFKLAKTVLTSTLTLGGNLGNTVNAQPLIFTSDIGGIGYPLQAGLLHTFIGDCAITFTEDGHISIVNANYGPGTSAPNSGPIDFEGGYSDVTNKISATLNGSYDSVGFEGSVTLSKQ
jgi:hypothetical protein